MIGALKHTEKYEIIISVTVLNEILVFGNNSKTQSSLLLSMVSYSFI